VCNQGEGIRKQSIKVGLSVNFEGKDSFVNNVISCDGLSNSNIPFKQTNIFPINVNEKVLSEEFKKPSHVNALKVINSAH
jgi:hypothetical protein